MARPLVYEVNTRCWLRELSERLQRPVMLDMVPEEEIEGWKRFGFSHIWLMGVWMTGPRSRAVARAQEWLRTACADAFGSSREEDIECSPYAIGEYVVAPQFGGTAALARLRARLTELGMKLLLDFVPNHTGLDHPWITEHPERYVHQAGPAPESFAAANCRIAHGKDPYFPPWTDTAQLEYRSPETRAALIDVLQSIAAQCDGVRCDMAMLVLNDVFQRTWGHWPAPGPTPATEFWADAIGAVKARTADFIFVAEAYWDLEERLQQLGFDYSYDKRFYDRIVRRENWEAHEARAFQPVRFLENHDEPRIASILNPSEQRAATQLLLRQPGMRLFHDGQLIGRRRRSPVQFARYWPEAPDPDITRMHQELLPDGEAGRLAVRSLADV